MEDYNSRHTGQVIDDAVDRAKDGGALDQSLAHKMGQAGLLTATDLFEWASVQTESCVFSVNGNNTLNVPVDKRWFKGMLDVSIGGKRLVLTSLSLGYVYDGHTYTSAFTGGAWQKWVHLATTTPPTEYALPLASGITESRSAKYFKTQDEVVTVGGEVIIPHDSIVDKFVIATLPSGFRPSTVISRGAVAWRATNAARAPAAILVGENGTIQLRISSNDIPASADIYLSFEANFVAAS